MSSHQQLSPPRDYECLGPVLPGPPGVVGVPSPRQQQPHEADPGAPVGGGAEMVGGLSEGDEDNNEVDMKCSLRAEQVVKELQEAAAAVANGTASADSSAGKSLRSGFVV